MINLNNELLDNLYKLHTTPLGIERIKRNLNINNVDVVKYLKFKIIDENSRIIKNGKNWYIDIDGIQICVNSHNYTIITAHQDKNKIKIFI